MKSVKITLGFSLIEMAFVLVIVTLLLGGLLVPFTTQVEQRRIAETQKAMAEINEALLGYSIANGYFPCPVPLSAVATGDAPSPCPSSTITTGFLPYNTLGVNRTDAWGHLYRYSVTGAFTATFGLPTYSGSTCLTNCGLISVQSRNASGATSGLSSNVVAVVISFGKNGYGAYSSDGQQLLMPPSTTDEYKNALLANLTPYFSRTQIGPRSGCQDAPSFPLCEFDDIVTWISPNILFNRMVAAGKLP